MPNKKVLSINTGYTPCVKTDKQVDKLKQLRNQVESKFSIVIHNVLDIYNIIKKLEEQPD